MIRQRRAKLHPSETADCENQQTRYLPLGPLTEPHLQGK